MRTQGFSERTESCSLFDALDPLVMGTLNARIWVLWSRREALPNLPNPQTAHLLAFDIRGLARVFLRNTRIFYVDEFMVIHTPYWGYDRTWDFMAPLGP